MASVIDSQQSHYSVQVPHTENMEQDQSNSMYILAGSDITIVSSIGPTSGYKLRL